MEEMNFQGGRSCGGPFIEPGTVPKCGIMRDTIGGHEFTQPVSHLHGRARIPVLPRLPLAPLRVDRGAEKLLRTDTALGAVGLNV